MNRFLASMADLGFVIPDRKRTLRGRILRWPWLPGFFLYNRINNDWKYNRCWLIIMGAA